MATKSKLCTFHFRLPKERRTPETYARGRLVATGDDGQGSVPNNRLEYEEVFTRQPPPHQLQTMNTPIRQQQQKVQQQHSPQKMQPNFQNPHIRDHTKQFPPQMQNRKVPNQQQYQAQLYDGSPISPNK